MSQSTRARVRAQQRHREQVARAIAEACGAAVAESVTAGARFDVHAAREYGEGLIAEARHAGVHAVVDDWRRAQGREPRQRPEVAECRYCEGRGCEECGGYGRVRQAPTWCDPPGLPPDVPGSALSWQASVRLGHRLLAALEGQPSECRACSGAGWLDDNDVDRHCYTCHGTGHNLHGVLPPVEWSPAVRWAAADAFAHDQDGYEPSSWPHRIFGESGARIDTGDREDGPTLTRVVPRGEHRDNSPEGITAWHPAGRRMHRDGRPIGWHPPLSPLVQATRLQGPITPDGQAPTMYVRRNLSPRWRRGEIKNAEQRRARGQLRAQAAIRTLAQPGEQPVPRPGDGLGQHTQQDSNRRSDPGPWL